MKKAVRYLLLLTAAVMAFFLTSCSNMDLGIEGLMLPPKLTGEQSKLYTALETAAGTENIRLRYPKEGENKSAFRFLDMDDDGTDEAIVFYSIQDDDATRVNILRNIDNKWISLYDSKGREDGVVSVELARFSTEKNCIVIGWQNTISENQVLALYDFCDNTLSEVFAVRYHAAAVCDLTYDGFDDVVVFAPIDGSGETGVSLVTLKGKSIETVSATKLALGAVSYQSLIEEKAGRLENALYADGKTTDGRYFTDIIFWENGRLKSFFSDKPEDIPLRYEELTCEDVDGDTVIEIPVQKVMTGTEAENEEPTYVTTYYQASAVGIYRDFTAIVNLNDGYMFELPHDWNDAVTLIKTADSGEWSINELLDGDIVGEELLKIKTVNKNTYHDKFDETYQLVAEKGVNQYYMFVTGKNSSLKKSFLECKNNFSVLER